jgi:hypothetical protein
LKGDLTKNLSPCTTEQAKKICPIHHPTPTTSSLLILPPPEHSHIFLTNNQVPPLKELLTVTTSASDKHFRLVRFMKGMGVIKSVAREEA